MLFLKAGHQLVKSVEISNNGDRKHACFHPGAYFRQLIGTITFFIVGILVSPVCWVIWKITRKRIPAKFGQSLLSRIFRGYVWWLHVTGVLRLETIGMEKLATLSGTIIVSNHPSLLDAVLLIALLPPTACVMRANLLGNPVLQGGALLAGYITNDSGPALVRQGIDKIRKAENLLIFPEGTRTVNEAVNSFKEGFAMVAVRTSAPVQTILIEHHGTHLSKGVSLFTPAVLPMHFTIRPGESFQPEACESARTFSQRIEKWFCAQLENTGAGIIHKNNTTL